MKEHVNGSSVDTFVIVLMVGVELIALLVSSHIKEK